MLKDKPNRPKSQESRAKTKNMKVNKQLTALCRRFEAAGLKVTERRGNCQHERIVRNIACDTFRVKFCNTRDPRIRTISDNYLTVTGFGTDNIYLSVFSGNLELEIE